MRVDTAYHMNKTSFNFSDLFESAPIIPQNEMSAYESLWTGQGAWFANLAELFRTNPGALPSELVPHEEISRTWEKLVDLVGEERLRTIGVRVNGAGEYPKK